MKAQEIVVSVKQDLIDSLNSTNWKLSGVSIKVGSFINNRPLFLSNQLNERQDELRERLLNIYSESKEEQNSIDSILLPILKIVNDYDNPHHDQNLIHAILCLTHLLADSHLLPISQRIRVFELIQENLSIPDLLDPKRFIDQYTPRLQKYIINIIELVGLRREKVMRD